MTNDFNFNEAVSSALRTWYPKEHPLHLKIHHPLGKLIGELGELLDDYMKSLYKPGYEFEPLDELGDIWYYLRILWYQLGCSGEEFAVWSVSKYKESTDWLLVYAIGRLTSSFLIDEISMYELGVTSSVVAIIANRYSITLDQLTQSNWEKLKPGSERGEEWMKAREIT